MASSSTFSPNGTTSFDKTERNYAEIKIPTPEIILDYNLKSNQVQFNGGYRGRNASLLPTKQIDTFAAQNYPAFGGPINLNDIVNVISAKISGTDYNWMNYNPKLVLYCKKKGSGGHSKDLILLNPNKLKKFEKKYVRVPDSNAFASNLKGDDSIYPRAASWPIIKDQEFIEGNIGLRTLLTGLQPKHYFKPSDALNSYGEDILPLSYDNWHGISDGVDFNDFGHGIKSYSRTNSNKHNGVTKRIIFVVRLEIENNLAKKSTNPKNQVLCSDFSNEIHFIPEIGWFYQPDGVTVARYFYKWKIELH